MTDDPNLKQYYKEYYQRNKSKMDASANAFQEKNKEALREYRRLYYQIYHHKKNQYKFIGDSKIFQIDTYTGEIINSQNQKVIPVKYDNTFMFLENKKVYEFKVILSKGKYKAIAYENKNTRNKCY